jgi:hypothetical protein
MCMCTILVNHVWNFYHHFVCFLYVYFNMCLSIDFCFCFEIINLYNKTFLLRYHYMNYTKFRFNKYQETLRKKMRKKKLVFDYIPWTVQCLNVYFFQKKISESFCILGTEKLLWKTWNFDTSKFEKKQKNTKLNKRTSETLWLKQIDFTLCVCYYIDLTIFKIQNNSKSWESKKISKSHMAKIYTWFYLYYQKSSNVTWILPLGTFFVRSPIPWGDLTWQEWYLHEDKAPCK